MKRISLDGLLHTRQNLGYQEQYEYIMKLLEKGQIKPVKVSKSNGKKPALYREYWMVEEQKDYSNYIYLNYICLFDYLFISSQMSAKPYFIGSTGILLLW